MLLTTRCQNPAAPNIGRTDKEEVIWDMNTEATAPSAPTASAAAGAAPGAEESSRPHDEVPTPSTQRLSTTNSPLDDTAPQMSLLKFPFPWKLHQLLDDAEAYGNDSIVSWLPSGAFQVHKPDEFVKHIMPKYFRQTKFKSFTRQVRSLVFDRVYWILKTILQLLPIEQCSQSAFRFRRHGTVANDLLCDSFICMVLHVPHRLKMLSTMPSL